MSLVRRRATCSHPTVIHTTCMATLPHPATPHSAGPGEATLQPVRERQPAPAGCDRPLGLPGQQAAPVRAGARAARRASAGKQRCATRSVPALRTLCWAPPNGHHRVPICLCAPLRCVQVAGSTDPIWNTFTYAPNAYYQGPHFDVARAESETKCAGLCGQYNRCQVRRQENSHG